MGEPSSRPPLGAGVGAGKSLNSRCGFQLSSALIAQSRPSAEPAMQVPVLSTAAEMHCSGWPLSSRIFMSGVVADDLLKREKAHFDCKQDLSFDEEGAL